MTEGERREKIRIQREKKVYCTNSSTISIVVLLSFFSFLFLFLLIYLFIYSLINLFKIVENKRVRSREILY